MIHTTLKQTFGFNNFRLGQEAVITNLINKESAVAVFPTGSGKSLCYQLAAMHLPHLTVVVSPLLALIQDQIDFMQKKNIGAVRIDSTLGRDAEIKAMEGIRTGEIKILMISVERFKNERFRRFLSSVPLSLLVVDEAHCISEWGHNFRPDYLKLPVYRKDFNIPNVLLLTATATPQVIEDMLAKFEIPASNAMVTGFYRSNLHIDVQAVSSENKDDYLYDIIKKDISAPTIVYVTLQKTAMTVAQILSQKGIHATPYHAGMKNEERERIQNNFMGGDCNCIVATIAFGMGIDKRDIRRVIHYDLPKSIENYSQEIGRAGRDGLKSDCIILANKDNLNVLENFVYGDTPELDSIQTLLKDIPTNDSNWEIKALKLSSASNIRLLPMKTLLVYLEMKGIIKPMFTYFSSYKFSNILTEKEICDKFSGERKEFTQAIFNHSQKARVWTTVEFEDIRQHYNTDRNRIVTALEYFNQNGFIKLEAKDMTEAFSVTNTNFDLNELSAELYQLFKQKEKIEIERIANMISFFESDTCLNKNLATYFGEELKNGECGHCSVCHSGKISIGNNLHLASLDSFNFNDMTKGIVSKLDTKASSGNISRFLCGIKIPLFTRIKASSMLYFAVFEQYPFAEVLAWVKSNMK
ncbi:MAG: RecQ family ATP-dependent DNA helicase [Bacteroidales bacterium]|nr:RecQ family ATP-dependent DNA helicase [Bacteroidales bacterium]